jgi:hypothetical protein
MCCLEISCLLCFYRKVNFILLSLLFLWHVFVCVNFNLHTYITYVACWCMILVFLILSLVCSLRFSVNVLILCFKFWKEEDDNVRHNGRNLDEGSQRDNMELKDEVCFYCFLFYCIVCCVIILTCLAVFRLCF